MGTHALGRILNKYTAGTSNLKCTRTRALMIHYKGENHENSRSMKRDFVRDELISARAAQGAENGYAGTSWTTTLPPAAAAAAARRRQSAQRPSDLVEEFIEKVIFNCRFFTLLAVVGSLSGSVLCFAQGCRFVTKSFFEYVHASWHGIDSGHVILSLVEAIDVFLVATVMMIFGMGVYELFVNTIGLQRKDDTPSGKNYTGSNLFGLFRLQERPLWLEIRSLHELKTKVGHVIVMILLVGMFEKSKLVAITTGFDLLCFSASILMSSGCLYLLSKLHSTN